MNTLVLDIGGTAIKYAVMDEKATIIEQNSMPTPHDNLETFIKTICDLYKKYQDQVQGLAISMPGNIDSDTGHIYAPGALLYNANTNIMEELHRHIDVNISVENDGKSAALAELWKGHLANCQSGVVLVLGSGIGGGIIQDRKVIKGNHFFAGEVSYLMTDLTKDVGMDNMFAMKSSTISLVMRVAKAKNINFESIDGKQVFTWIKEGDKDALKAFDDMTTVLTHQIYNLQCLLDPEKILIGGGVSKQKLLIETVQKKLEAMYNGFPFPIPRAQVEACKYHNNSNLIGALYNYKIHFGGLHHE